jgi:hypothetical protein
MAFYQIKNLLYSKANNNQIEERAYRVQENLHSSSSDKGLISRIYKKPKVARTNNLVNKLANELGSSQEKYYVQ